MFVQNFLTGVKFMAQTAHNTFLESFGINMSHPPRTGLSQTRRRILDLLREGEAAWLGTECSEGEERVSREFAPAREVQASADGDVAEEKEEEKASEEKTQTPKGPKIRDSAIGGIKNEGNSCFVAAGVEGHSMCVQGLRNALE